MQFSIFVIGSLLALITTVASQVIVTVTSTVTIITITATVTPLSTSTTTKFVTVTGNSPPHSTPTATTSTKTVTVTAGQPTTTVAAVCPLGLGGSCGLWNPDPNGCRSCANGLTCRSIMWSSSRCETNAATIVTLTSTVYRK